MVLEVLAAHQLYENTKKCSLAKPKWLTWVTLYHKKGVAMDQDKVQAMLARSSPWNLKVLRGFLGLTGYYPRFIHNYIATPYTHQLKKDCFN